MPRFTLTVYPEPYSDTLCGWDEMCPYAIRDDEGDWWCGALPGTGLDEDGDGHPLRSYECRQRAQPIPDALTEQDGCGS